LSELAERIACAFPLAAVEEQRNVGITSVTPPPGACPLSWLDWGDEISFGVGTGAGAWELSPTAEDLRFMQDVIDAVVVGNVSEVFARGRSQVTVRLKSGSPAVTTASVAPLGCLPMPFWTRRGRRVHYLGYAEDANRSD
jgi:hypothetical protein